MNALSVSSSTSNVPVRTALAQQRVVEDRDNIRETEAQLDYYKNKLDEDLTYLAKLQRRVHDVQSLENSQAQSTILNRITKEAKLAERFAEENGTTLTSFTPARQTLGSNINIVA